MRSSSARHGALLGVVVVAVGAAGIVAGREGPRVAAAATPSALELRDRDIAFFERRAAEDTTSAEDRARLAALWLQRGRESGELADYARSESAARASLAIRERRNAKSRHLLASSLLAQHRFAEALAEAERLVHGDGEVLAYRALLGEIQLELGRYAEADRTLDPLRRHWRDLAVAPRLARRAEVRGRLDEARVIMEAARAEAMRRTELPREQVAWFHLRAGDLALQAGRLAEATRAANAGLDVVPDDVRLYALHARIAAARGRWCDAIDWGERGGDANDVATMALVGDAWAVLGDSVRAAAWWDRADGAGIARQEPFNRQWTQFRIAHGRDLAGTRAILEREARERPDLLGLTLLAEARRRTGDTTAERVAIARAKRISRQLPSSGPPIPAARGTRPRAGSRSGARTTSSSCTAIRSAASR